MKKRPIGKYVIEGIIKEVTENDSGFTVSALLRALESKD